MSWSWFQFSLLFWWFYQKFLPQGEFSRKTRKQVKLQKKFFKVSQIKLNFSVCKRGSCIDYCDIENLFLEPGETFEKDCGIVRCLEDFSVVREGCGILKQGSCWLKPDFSIKYPGELYFIKTLRTFFMFFFIVLGCCGTICVHQDNCEC